MLALAFIERLGRKKMLIIGFFVMTLFDVLTGIAARYDSSTFEKVAILLFIATF